jgi:hypothetical protein
MKILILLAHFYDNWYSFTAIPFSLIVSANIGLSTDHISVIVETYGQF